MGFGGSPVPVRPCWGWWVPGVPRAGGVGGVVPVGLVWDMPLGLGVTQRSGGQDGGTGGAGEIPGVKGVLGMQRGYWG